MLARRAKALILASSDPAQRRRRVLHRQGV